MIQFLSVSTTVRVLCFLCPKMILTYTVGHRILYLFSLGTSKVLLHDLPLLIANIVHDSIFHFVLGSNVFFPLAESFDIGLHFQSAEINQKKIFWFLSFLNLSCLGLSESLLINETDIFFSSSKVYSTIQFFLIYYRYWTFLNYVHCFFTCSLNSLFFCIRI